MHNYSWQAINEMIGKAQQMGPGEYNFSLCAYEQDRDNVLAAKWRVTITVMVRRIIVDMLRVD